MWELNYPREYEDMKCPICNQKEDTKEHVLECQTAEAVIYRIRDNTPNWMEMVYGNSIATPITRLPYILKYLHRQRQWSLLLLGIYLANQVPVRQLAIPTVDCLLIKLAISQLATKVLNFLDINSQLASQIFKKKLLGFKEF